MNERGMGGEEDQGEKRSASYAPTEIFKCPQGGALIRINMSI